MMIAIARALTILDEVDRQRTRRERSPSRPIHPIGTPSGLSPNTGPLAAAAWLLARGLFARDSRWFVEIQLAAGETQFVIEIYAEEWGFAFRHQGRVSWIRVTDIPFVHGRDEHLLLAEAPKLRDIGKLIAKLEARYQVAFPRTPEIRTNLADPENCIRDWASKL